MNVVLGLVYYVRWGALLFSPASGRALTWRVSVGEGLALGASGAASVALSVWPQAIAGSAADRAALTASPDRSGEGRADQR